MKVMIHRGSNQIGGTIIELAAKKTRIILDIGQVLPNMDGTAVKASMDKPPVEGLFKGEKEGIDGVFISHGHGDHLGLLPELKENVPIFMGEKTAAIYNMIGKFTGADYFVKPAGFLVHEKPITIGDFVVTPYLIDHSAFDAYGFIINCEGKSVVYTGDIREHGKKASLTKYFRSKLPTNADILIMEGTMLGRADEKLETEEEIGLKAAKLMKEIDKPVFVLQSAANIDRLVAMYNATKERDRVFIIDIFTANILNSIGGAAAKILTKARVVYPFELTDKMFSRGEKELMYKFVHRKIKLEELNTLTNYCMLVRSSMVGFLNNLKGIENSTMIYSMWRGYEKRTDIKRLIDFADSKSIKIQYLHTSGHGGIDTLKKLAEGCKAKKIVPVHTEYPERYQEIFKNAYIINDRQGIEI